MALFNWCLECGGYFHDTPDSGPICPACGVLSGHVVCELCGVVHSRAEASWKTKCTNEICASLPTGKLKHISDERPLQEDLFSKEDIEGRFRWIVQCRFSVDALVRRYPVPPRPDSWWVFAAAGEHSSRSSALQSISRFAKQNADLVFRAVAVTP